MESEQQQGIDIGSQIVTTHNTSVKESSSLDVPRKMSDDAEASNTSADNAAANTPKRVLQAVYALGQWKANEPWNVLSLQAFQAGLYKSIACQLYLTVGGGILGAALFPTGLIAILLTGAELFTSDSLFMVASFLGGKIKYGSLVRNCTLSWIFNYIGVLFWAGFLTYFSGQLEFVGQVDYAVEFAEHKAHQPWHEIFLRGIGANFLICLAVWQSTTARQVAGKVLGIWFPVAAFIVLGFDHCIANMYYLTLGIRYGADISVVQLLFLDLLPATLGNTIGGGIGMGVVYWYLYDSVSSRAQLVVKVQEAFLYSPAAIHPNVEKAGSGNSGDMEG